MRSQSGVGDGQVLYKGKWIADVRYDIITESIGYFGIVDSVTYEITKGSLPGVLDENALELVDQNRQVYRMALTKHGFRAKLMPIPSDS